MLVASKSKFGERLRELREGAGISQYELAKRSKVTAQAISRLEKGEREPNWITVLRLARALDLSISDFDTGETLDELSSAAPESPPPPPAPPNRRGKK